MNSLLDRQRLLDHLLTTHRDWSPRDAEKCLDDALKQVEAGFPPEKAFRQAEARAKKRAVDGWLAGADERPSLTASVFEIAGRKKTEGRVR